MRISVRAAGAVLLLAGVEAFGADAAAPVELEATRIRGDRELPRVLGIVPWRAAGAAELSDAPFERLVDEVLAPLDRDAFRRELEYHDTLTAILPRSFPRTLPRTLAKTLAMTPETVPQSAERGIADPTDPISEAETQAP